MTHRPHTRTHTTHAVFAGAWPHIKSLASLLCWTLDGRRLGSNARRALMTLAYVLQKLSHVETFVLVRFAWRARTGPLTKQSHQPPSRDRSLVPCHTHTSR